MWCFCPVSNLVLVTRYSFYVNYVNQNETDSVEFFIAMVIFSARHIKGFGLVNIVFGP